MTLSRVVRKIAMPVQYDDRTIDYLVKDALGGGKKSDIGGKTNPETWKLMKEGYVVLKNFIPKDIIEFTMDSWKVMELDHESYPLMAEKEEDIIENSPEDTLFKSTGIYNAPFGVALHHYVWDKLKSHIDLELHETYSYSRKYDRGAYLKAHADRPSCEISGTLCLDYRTDDSTPWSIWVDNSSDWINRPNEIFEETQAIPMRQRKTAKRIDLEIGDLLLYQGPNVAHWREKLLGEHSYHIFVHFYNVNGGTLNMPGSDDAFEHVPQEVRHRQEEFNPLMYDGRVSRYHPIEKTWQRKSFDTFMSKCWHNKGLWANHNKSDFINNYEPFVQVKDGKEVKGKELFKPKYEEEVKAFKVKRRTPR